MFRTVSLSVIRSFSLYTQQWYMSCRFSDSLLASFSLYTHHCCVYSEKTPDDGQRNCPKHVEFYSKNKFEKLVHLIGFIVRLRFHLRYPVLSYSTTNYTQVPSTPQFINVTNWPIEHTATCLFAPHVNHLQAIRHALFFITLF